MSIPVVVSITTLPSRIGKMRPCLDSLLAGDVVPDKILLPLPNFSQRENCAYEIPAFLKTQYGTAVEIVAAEQDFGPGTKVLGVLNRIPDPCYLIAADDDVSYQPHFLSGLLAGQRGAHAASFSYHTYRTGGLTIGQACDGFSFYSPNLRGLDAFYQDHVSGTDLFYHDDLWFSFFLFLRGIAIKRPVMEKGAGPVYSVVHNTNQLHTLSGELARKQLNRRGIQRLLQTTKTGPRKKYRLQAVAVFDGLITSPVRRLKRKADQLKRGAAH
ncbi:MAG: hypothetical protein P4N60_07675 [Verrucomicrobiae bacterium]|nr:hypothetical protein [Verrucomicrobiae bacterium]